MCYVVWDRLEVFHTLQLVRQLFEGGEKEADQDHFHDGGQEQQYHIPVSSW